MLVSLLPFCQGVHAGLDKFTYLDKIKDWTIERKIDPVKTTASCRASIIKHGSWFGSRIRLDRNDQLLYPTEALKKIVPSISTIERVKRALKACRAGLIYLPQDAGNNH